MTSFTSAHNPWSDSDTLSGIRLGNPQGGLGLARSFGLLSDGGDFKDRGPLIDKRLARCSSIKLIEVLQELSQISQELDQVEFEIQRHLLDRETADLTHVDILDSRIQRVDSLLNHFTSVISSKDHLLGRLQSRATNNSLKIEAPCQKDVSEVLSLIGPAISDLPADSKRLQWARELDILKTPMEDKLASQVQSLVHCKAVHQQSQDLHDLALSS